MLKATFTKHQLEFINPAGTSRGVLNYKDSWFLKVYDVDKPEVVGVGEIAPLPNLSVELRDNFEFLIEKLCENINEIVEDFHFKLQEFPSLRFGLEMAMRDLETGGKRVLFPGLFTDGKASMTINGLVWMGDYQYMFDQLKQKVESGYSCIKLKIGAINFEEEIKLLAYIRKHFNAKDIEIRVDANGAFSSDEALEKLKRLAAYDLHSIEQPIKQGQWEEMAALCKVTPLPIALDEELIGLNVPQHKEVVLETIMPQYIILKPSLIGGFKSSSEWIDLAKKNNIGWWITSALESNVGLNAITQWTYTLESEMPQGLGTGKLYRNNIESPLYIKGDQIAYDPQIQWNLNF